MRAQNFIFVLKFYKKGVLVPNSAFLDEKFQTGRRLSDSQKFRGTTASLSLLPQCPALWLCEDIAFLYTRSIFAAVKHA